MNSSFLSKWLAVSFFNLLLVASLGTIMRYKIAFYLPFVEQQHVLHSHSHFAFAGWITQTLMVLLIHNLSLEKGVAVFDKYRWLLYANVITAYGMLVSFFIEGYAGISISFSTLSIFVSYFFAIFYWKDLNGINENKVSHWWLKSSLVFSVVSSIGTFYLAYMMLNRAIEQSWYLASVYFFLHFQYNGWFFFAGMGLLTSKLEKIKPAVKNLKIIFLLFCFAGISAYFLSVLWLPLPHIIYWIMTAAVLAQLTGWILLIKLFIKNKNFVDRQFSKYGKILLLFSAIAFSIKLLMQSLSIHPALSQLAFGFRPIVIGYLHLVLLAVTSVFIIGYIVSFELIPVTKKLINGISIFIAGIIVNEILLMIQGVAALTYRSIPYINILLFIAALILLSGASMMFRGLLRGVGRL